VTPMIRLVVVDDHPAIVEALRARAVEEGDLEVVGSADSVGEAQRVIAAADPDVVVCDLQLAGDGDGFQLLRSLGGHPRPAMLMLSAFDAPSLVRSAFELGAAGYLPKSSDLATIVAAVRDVAAGRAAYPASALRAMRAAPRPPSDREIQVLTLVMAGATNGEIGASLGLSEKTVESHLRRMFDRYGVLSRTELVVLAIREGWLHDRRAGEHGSGIGRVDAASGPGARRG